MTSEELIGKYIGDQKVQAVSPADEAGKVNVVLENGKTFYILPEVIAGWATENPKDLTSLRELMVVPVVVEMLNSLSKHQFKIEFYDYLQMKLKASIDESAGKASELLWGKDQSELTITDIEKILTK